MPSTELAYQISAYVKATVLTFTVISNFSWTCDWSPKSAGRLCVPLRLPGNKISTFFRRCLWSRNVDFVFVLSFSGSLICRPDAPETRLAVWVSTVSDRKAPNCTSGCRWSNYHRKLLPASLGLLILARNRRARITSSDGMRPTKLVQHIIQGLRTLYYVYKDTVT